MSIKILLKCTFLSALTFPPAFANEFENANYTLCFTPGGECRDLIVEAMDNAKRTMLVQAYGFNSQPIIDAVVNAQQRGVDVKVILDKTLFTGSNPTGDYLVSQSVPVWEDKHVAIAHNKVIIIDDETVVTGSFNFTENAQNKNAENSLIITDAALAKDYTDNWLSRQEASEKR